MAISLKMKNITKIYPGVTANDNVSIEAPEGSVLCIIGENGAGKSTLMNVLYGMEKADRGEILLNDSPVNFSSSRDAMKHRIGMVFQHFMLINELSCLENIILGMEPKSGVGINFKKARADIEQIMEQYNMKIPLDEPAGNLWVGLQQKLEIIKTLYRGAEIIILDEPTAVLTPQETEELFVNMKMLASMGKTIIFITHKLNEVMEVADNIYVMRAGKLVGEVKPIDTSVEDLAIMMVGHELPPMRDRAEVEPEAIMKLEGVSYYKENGLHALRDLSFTLKKGEILGIAGISGNGQNELAQLVAGLRTPAQGKVIIDGKDVTNQNRHQRINEGVSYVPEDRNAMGACLPWSIEDNSFAGYQHLPRFKKKFGFIDRKETKKLAVDFIEAFKVKTPDEKRSIKSLSGGNCQKVIVARETNFGASVIVCSEPSRGVDIGAINFIHSHMIDLRNSGTAILLISSSLDEIFGLSDRIAVLYEGEITAVVDPKTTTKEDIGLYMSGAKRGDLTNA